MCPRRRSRQYQPRFNPILYRTEFLFSFKSISNGFIWTANTPIFNKFHVKKFLYPFAQLAHDFDQRGSADFFLPFRQYIRTLICFHIVFHTRLSIFIFLILLLSENKYVQKPA